MSRTAPSVTFPNLGTLRTQLRMNASELARGAEVSRSSIVKAEKGSPVDVVVCLRIADFLEQTANSLGQSPNSQVRSEIKEFQDFALKAAVARTSDPVDKGEPKALTRMKDTLDEFFEKGYVQYLNGQQRRELAVFLEDYAHRLRRASEGGEKIRY